MRFISSMTWIKKGVSKTPIRIKIDQEEMKNLFTELDKPELEDEENEGDEVEENGQVDSTQDQDEDEKINKKYNLDSYEQEEDELKMEQLNSLACFANNAQDSYLTKHDDGEDSDEEDIEIKPSDNLLVCGTVDEEDCSLNIYVYNEEEGNFYIHHDILLSSTPICVEWLDFDPTNKDSSVNYLAVGSMDPWIEIWDLDIMDSLEPEFILGSRKKIKKKKSSDLNKKQKLIGHKDAVLDLSYNILNRNILASGSADKTICLWDLEKFKQATKIKNHKDRVQALQFHPVESFSLLSGSCDSTCALYDCRNPSTNKKTWSLENDIERVIWNTHDPNKFLCSNDEGLIYLIDIRNDKPLTSINAHESSVSGLSLSSQVPGLLISADEDELMKIWDIKNDSFELVYETTLKTGAVNCIKSSPDSGFVFSIGGVKTNEPKVWDIRELKEIRSRFYERIGLKETEEEEEVTQKKEQSLNKRAQRAQKFKNLNNKKTNNKRKLNK